MRAPVLSQPEPATPFPVGIGDVVSSKYEIDAILGEGGMGFVLRAVHIELRDFVALKFLRPEAVERADVKARFRDEARAAVRLRDEHVAQVRDVGEHNGLPYIVMEYLNGRDLRDILMQDELLPVELIAEYIIQACAGLAEAHLLGIVHRDIKPENLFVTERSTGGAIVKILDFGISKVALRGNTSEMSLQGGTRDIIGSPLYMSPEQIRTPHDIDRRVDVWSLGVVLFEMLTGNHPFGDAREFPLLVANVLEQKCTKASSLRKEIHPNIDAIIERALAKNPADRYPSVGDLAMALAPFARTGARQLAADTARAMIVRGWSEIKVDALNSSFPPSQISTPSPLPVGANAADARRSNAGTDSTPPGFSGPALKASGARAAQRVPSTSAIRRVTLDPQTPAPLPTRLSNGALAALAIALTLLFVLAGYLWRKSIDPMEANFQIPTRVAAERDALPPPLAATVSAANPTATSHATATQLKTNDARDQVPHAISATAGTAAIRINPPAQTSTTTLASASATATASAVRPPNLEILPER